MTAKVRQPNLNTASVRLVDRRTRVVEVLGPEPAGSRRPTDRQLLYEPYGPAAPREVGMCFQADGRRARFLVEESPFGDAFLDKLAKFPDRPSRPARPWGPTGYLVRG